MRANTIQVTGHTAAVSLDLTPDEIAAALQGAAEVALAELRAQYRAQPGQRGTVAAQTQLEQIAARRQALADRRALLESRLRSLGENQPREVLRPLFAGIEDVTVEDAQLRDEEVKARQDLAAAANRHLDRARAAVVAARQALREREATPTAAIADVIGDLLRQVLRARAALLHLSGYDLAVIVDMLRSEDATDTSTAA